MAGAAALLNLSGLGLGYLYLGRWRRWLVHSGITAVLVIAADMTNAARTPLPWLGAFALWLVWMGFDGWRQARRVEPPAERSVADRILPFGIAILVGALEIIGFLAYAGQGEQEFAAGMSAYQANDCAQAIARLTDVTTTYRLTFSPNISAADFGFATGGRCEPAIQNDQGGPEHCVGPRHRTLSAQAPAPRSQRAHATRREPSQHQSRYSRDRDHILRGGRFHLANVVGRRSVEVVRGNGAPRVTL